MYVVPTLCTAVTATLAKQSLTLDTPSFDLLVLQ